jgi:tetratricopeptide (TPR) repeat protein
LTPLEKELKLNKDRFEALAPEDQSDEAMKRITALGASYRALGKWDLALRIFDMGASSAERAGDAEAVSGFLISKSRTFFHMGLYARAIEFATRAIALPVPGVDRADYISRPLANPYLLLGDLNRYVALQQEALSLTKLLQDEEEKEHLPWILCRLAEGWDMMGDHKRANPVLVDHVAIFRSREHRYGLPYSMLILGKNLLNLGRPQESEQFLTEALVLFEENEQEGSLVETLVGLSSAADAMGNMEEARLYADEAVEEAKRGPRKREGLADTRYVNQALIQAAKIYQKLDRRHEALEFYGQGLELAAKYNRRLILAELLKLQELLTTTPHP